MTEHTLPELTDERIDELEDALFTEIARERARDERRVDEVARRRRLRRTRWLTGGGIAAAVVIVAAVIAPYVTQSIGSGSDAASSAYDTTDQIIEPMAVDGDGGRDAELESLADEAAGGGDTSATAESGDAPATSVAEDRSIIVTASATVEVDDIGAAAEAISNAATAVGGYVESMSIDGTAVSPSGDAAYDTSYPAAGAWISVRVPADELDGVRDALASVGDVSSSQITRDDVTTAVVDTQARVEALRASVDRLTDLMAEATSTADLLEAESALSERQAELESYEQQLTALESQVSLSTLSVSLVNDAPTEVEPDPAGFGDGLATGWNGLIATLNGLVVALGFLLPWLGVLAVIGGIVWLIVRRRRRRRPDGVSDSGARAD